MPVAQVSILFLAVFPDVLQDLGEKWKGLSLRHIGGLTVLPLFWMRSQSFDLRGGKFRTLGRIHNKRLSKRAVARDSCETGQSGNASGEKRRQSLRLAWREG